MKTSILQDYAELSEQTAQIIADYVKAKPRAALCLAGGDTPRGTYANLVKRAQAGEVDFSQCVFVGLDEWVGLPPDYPGSCYAFMQESLFGPMSIRPEQIVFFDAVSNDLPAECSRIDDFLAQRGPLDIVLLGMGMNGHLGMNEPGCDEFAAASVTELDSVTVHVGQKYFSGNPAQPELKQGITLGMTQLMQARLALLIISGERKAATAAAALEGPVSNQLPASLLRKHANAQVLLDQAAASLLRPAPNHPD